MPAPTIDTPMYGGRATCHFLTGRHYYLISVPSKGRAKLYQPGVTSILGIKDKSAPLMYWAVDQCELYVLQQLENGRLPIDQSIPLDLVKQLLSEMKSKYRETKKEAAEVGKVVHDYLHHTLLAKQLHRPEPTRPTRESLGEAYSEEMYTQITNAIFAGLDFFSQHKLEPLTMERPVWSPTHGYIGTDDFIGYVDGELCVIDYKTGKRLYPEVWLQTAAYKAAYQEEFPDKQIGGCWGVNVGKDGELDAIRRGPEYFKEDFKAFLGLRDVFFWNRVHGSDPKSAIEVIGPLPVQPSGKVASWIDDLEGE